MNKKKCCFIVPYFGEFPNYFPLFLKSCGYNTNYDWLIITDIDGKYSFPNNVKLIKMSFQQLKKKIEIKLGFEIELSSYHKLCDYKPTYGYIFEQYISEYPFWGNCDIDLIFGNLDNFISESLMEKYDKLFCLGHFTMYKNTKTNNRLFMNKLNGREIYRDVYTTPKTMIFDEPYGIGIGNCINDIFERYQKNIYLYDHSVNPKIAPANIVRTVFIPQKMRFENKKNQSAIYILNDGNLECITKKKKKLCRKQYMYFHFQSRKMKYNNELLSMKRIKILGDGFYNLEFYPISIKNFSKIKKKIISLRYFQIMFSWKYKGLNKKIKSFVNIKG